MVDILAKCCLWLVINCAQVQGIFYNHFDINYNIDRGRYPLSTYDFIIVGSGSSGSVLANRLSENPVWKVLLLEVGKRQTIVSDVPFLAPALQFTDYVWNYKMEETAGVCLGMEEQRCPWPRGRGLGGTTLINYMIYTRGHKKDYDNWAAQGNPGWSYEEVLPYFLKSENSSLRFVDERYHSTEGPLNVEDARWRSKVVEAFILGGKELGHPYVDYNGRSQDGFSYVQANTRRGVRDSGYTAFIKPVEQRANLHILTGSRATKLLINPDTKQVYGLEYVRNRRYHYVNVSKEVILSAGAFNSPQLLMLSGVGPKKHLESLGIPVLKDLPVGQNMHDHITFLGLFYTYEKGDTGLEPPETYTNISTMLNWLTNGRGPLTSIGGVEALGYINTKVRKDLDIPDMEFIVLSGRFSEEIMDILRKSFGIKLHTFNTLWDKARGKHLGVFLPMHLKPLSIGHLELKSKNPYKWPLLYGNHLTDPGNLDVKAFVASIRFIQKLVGTNAYRKYNATYVGVVIPGCEQPKYDSDEYWECAVRHLSTTLHHQVGTCKMGPEEDPSSVVDAELRVHGLKGIRVADTSIIPFALNAHTNAPAYMVGEKTADYIKKTWMKSY